MTNPALIEAMARAIEAWERDPSAIRRHGWRDFRGHANAALHAYQAYADGARGQALAETGGKE